MSEGTALAHDWYELDLSGTPHDSVAPRSPRKPKQLSSPIFIDLSNTAPVVSGEYVVAATSRLRFLTRDEEEIFAIALSRSVRLVSKGRK
jgi:hypothetical protein